MTLSIYAVRVSARMLVSDTLTQADDAERVLIEAVARINAEFTALSVQLSPLDEVPVDDT